MYLSHYFDWNSRIRQENRILKEEIRRLNTVRVTPKPAKSSDSDLEVSDSIASGSGPTDDPAHSAYEKRTNS